MEVDDEVVVAGVIVIEDSREHVRPIVAEVLAGRKPRAREMRLRFDYSSR